MSDPMAEIKASFFIECEELLEALQDGLTALDSGDDDPETINVCFRAVHSIKGGAGAFGLDQLVKFAHRYETVMDAIRSGDLVPDRDAMLLFFRAADLLSDIVRSAQEDQTLPDDQLEGTLIELEGLTGGTEAEEEEEEVVDFQPMTLGLGDDPTDDELPHYKMRFKPEPELFKSGNEPQHILKMFCEAGQATLACDASAIPLLDQLDPEGAYLEWTCEIETETSEEELREVFDFVDGLCTLDLTQLNKPAVPGVIDLPDIEIDLDIDFPSAGDSNEDPSEQAAVETSTTKTPSEAASPKPAATAPAEGKSKAPATAGNPTVRVDLDRIDRLVNLVGELVINQAMLSQSVSEAGLNNNSQVTAGLEEFMQLTRDIQDSVMMIRAQPVKSLFQRMSRIVRESSAAIGKRVNFVTVGDNTEVDKTVIERLADPLTHMIRNAVDHGLEAPEKRLETGKTEDGTVTLSAAHKSGRVIIEIADDGAGINRPKVQNIAETKGLIPPGSELSDSEIDALLFLPGFSTATEVSNLSGRGVGMDVVRSAIQALGGRVTISSEPGSGTVFSISLPLTLAVLDGMVVKLGSETLVIPLGAIIETVSLQNEDVRTVGQGSKVIHIREKFVPIIDLGAVLGYRPYVTQYEGMVVLLIAQEDGSQAAILADSIVEQRQVVIKGLQQAYGHVPGIAAATILGDGQIALIVDPVDLMVNAVGRQQSHSSPVEMAG